MTGMKWWFKARRGHTLLPLTLTVFLLFVIVVRNSVIGLPSLLSGGGDVVLMTFAPIPVTSGLMAVLDSRLDAPETSGIRPVAVLDSLLVLAVAGLAALIGLIAGTALGQPDAIITGRNTAFLVGLTLCVRAVAGPAAVMAPVGWLMLVILVGVGPDGDPYPWTVVRPPLDSWPAAVAAVLVLAAGTAAVLRPALRRPRRPAASHARSRSPRSLRKT
ncbi:hypothetical protein [Streptomyces sp. NPDC020965]|uniref:hypothetical protein n=1 Tax=Streptomyces sp. NPDC020965 TaxID=3365105 RepID=UPI003790C976